jgi:hypothetical protein
MNNDLYYLKYIKYKTKYLDEKNKVGGACDLQTMKINFYQLSPINQVIELFNLLKTNANEENIIEKIINIYDTIVIPLKDKKKYTKDCLKEVLTNYLNLKKKDIDKKEYSTFTINNITYESLNIKEKEDIFFEKNIVKNTEFSRGTALIFKEYKGVYVRNLRYLTNLFNIKFEIDKSTYAESLRFGTPYVPDSDNIKKILKILPTEKKSEYSIEIKEYYDSQINILKSYIGEKRCIFISLLDICDSKICKEKLVGEKVIENEIVHKEIIGYSSNPEIVYLSMPCNNSVNLVDNISVISKEELVPILEKYFDTLGTWLLDDPILKKLKENDNFFEKFKNNVLKNNSLDIDLLKKLSINRFVLKKKSEKSGKIGTLKNFIDTDMEELSPCLEDLTNENIRLVMFCYISLIFYILSKNNRNKYILLYHCKSGQDRTGTFNAINQMVNEITKKEGNYQQIIELINNKTSFIDIFIQFYSLTPTEYIKEDIIEKKVYEKKFCPITPRFNLVSLNKKINKEVELCYLRYLLLSYIITITSTGCPGLKWNLINNNILFKFIDKRTYDTGSSISNRFPYLLLSNPFYALLFEGASEKRGS